MRALQLSPSFKGWPSHISTLAHQSENSTNEFAGEGISFSSALAG
jgi:hypothetical protein